MDRASVHQAKMKPFPMWALLATAQVSACGGGGACNGAAYSMLLNRGVFRIAMKIPATAEFELVKADDPADQDAIVAFEKTLFVAQQVDASAGLLFAADGTGGAASLSTTGFSFGGNDIFTAVSTGNTSLFNQNIFSLFSSGINDASASDPRAVAAGQAIARGQAIFNTKSKSKDVPGTEALGFAFPTCGICHSVPNVGSMPEPRYFSIGTADADDRTADMPLYTLKNKKTGDMVETQDPGRAMASGLWKGIGRFKTPVLRGLSTGAPYFHDGSAKTTADLIASYGKKFSIQFTPQEMADVNVFLKAL